MLPLFHFRFMKNTFLLLAFWALCAHGAAAQSTFYKKFSNLPLNPEAGWKAQEVSDGYLLLSGAGCVENTSQGCATLSKLDKNGDVVWFKQYPFYPGGENSVGIFQDSIIFLSGSAKFNGDYQHVLYRLNQQGEVMWNKVYGDSTKRELSPQMAIRDTIIYLYGGRIKYAPEGSYLNWILKLDIHGKVLSEGSYGWALGTASRSRIISLKNGGVLFSYEKCEPHVTCLLNTEGAVTQLNSEGEEGWSTDFNTTLGTHTCQIAVLDDNTYVASWVYDTLERRPPVLYFLDSLGHITDRHIYFNSTSKDIYALSSLPQGNFIGMGYAYLSQDTAGAWVFCMNAQKEVLWERLFIDTTYQGDYSDFYNGMPTSDGGMILCGSVINNMTGVREAHNTVYKLDSKGCLRPGCGYDNFLSGAEDITFLRGEGIRAYPNPTSGLLNVEMPEALRGQRNSRAIVWSAQGEKVREYTGKTFEQYNYYDLSSLPAGMYALVLMIGNEVVEAKQVVVQR